MYYMGVRTPQEGAILGISSPPMNSIADGAYFVAIRNYQQWDTVWGMGIDGHARGRYIQQDDAAFCRLGY